MIHLNIDRNFEAERSVIGAILKEPKCINLIQHRLSADDFTSECCGDIYEAAVDAYERGKDYDPISAVDTAKRHLSNVDAPQFILDCVELTPTTTNVEQHAGIVRHYADMRRMKDAAHEIIAEATTAQQMAASLVEACYAFMQDKRPDRVSTLSDALVSLYTEKTTKQTRIDTGYEKLDEKLKGMYPGNLVLIGARPGVGKSVIGSDIAIYNACKGNATAFFTLEMSREEVSERLIAQRSTIGMDTLIDSSMTDEQWQEFQSVSNKISTIPLYISDDPHLTISKIRSVARSVKDLKLVVVDYIQLMTPEGRHDNRTAALGSLSRGLKLLAGELRVPIVALSQLNRGDGENEFNKPTLGRLRDSGELEQDANKVIFLWRTEELPDDVPQKVGVCVAKNRRGRLGTIINIFDGSHMKFTETDEKYVPAKQTLKKKADTPF